MDSKSLKRGCSPRAPEDHPGQDRGHVQGEASGLRPVRPMRGEFREGGKPAPGSDLIFWPGWVWPATKRGGLSCFFGVKVGNGG